MNEERDELSLEEVTGNALSELNSMKSTDEGHQNAVKAADVLLKYNNESEKNDLTREQIESTERIEMAKIEVEKARIEAEAVQNAEDNKLRDKEIKAGVVDSVLKSVVVATVVGEISYHIGMKKIGKFEETGFYRSLLSKTWIGRLGKRK